MNRYLPLILITWLLVAPLARAEEMPPMPRMDDRVVFDVSAEDWVTTKTARVTANIEASVSSTTAGGMRADMMKAVDDLAKADWRLTSFSRSQDQTGLERWSANFEARLPENELNGLNDSAKKLSKAGMQLSVDDIDFSPTLEEMEAARGALRSQIYKNVNDQLAVLNAAMPGRNYRIAAIEFANGEGEMRPRPLVMMKAQSSAMMAPAAASEPSMERSQKEVLMAHVILAAMPPVPPVAPEPKH